MIKSKKARPFQSDGTRFFCELKCLFEAVQGFVFA